MPSGIEKELPSPGTVSRVDDTPPAVDTVPVEDKEIDVLFAQLGDEIIGLSAWGRTPTTSSLRYWVSSILAMACPKRAGLLALATGPNDSPAARNSPPARKAGALPPYAASASIADVLQLG